ncbi:MAG TPA: hypothetical protein VFZ52_23150 [Chryseolinea sp.]
MKGFYFFVSIFLISSFTVSAQDKFISVGSGGGFAGTSTVFKVMPNGIIFKGTGIGEVKFSLCGRIKKGEAKQMVKRVAQQVEAATDFNHPGNLFYFISYTEDNNKRTITWGDADHPVQGDLKKLYDEVLASVNDVSFRPIK